MNRGFIIAVLALLFSPLWAKAQHLDRGYDDPLSTPFVRKGTWVAGGIVNYTQHVNTNYKILVIDNVNSKGYNISVKPNAYYIFKDNMGAGLRLSYKRSMLDLASANIALAEISMGAKDCYQIQHTYGAHAALRAYIPFADVRRVALYADLALGGAFGQSKIYNAGGPTVYGTYANTWLVELTVNPGMLVFLTDHFALEMNAAIFGLNYKWINQIHNQALRGDTDTASAGFTLNLLSVGVGISYYFL